MSAFDYVACATVESSYRAYTSLLDQIIEYPLLMLKYLRNVIKMMKATVYSPLLSTYEYLEELLDKLLNFPDPGDLQNDFCDALLKCEFLYKSVLPPTSTPGSWTDPLTGDQLTGYDYFKKYMCGSGFGDFFANIKAALLAEVALIIDSIMGTVDKGFAFIDESISKARDAYTNFLNAPIKSYFSLFPTTWNFLYIFNWVDKSVFDPDTASILDLIDLIELFGECVFSVCDLSVTVKNKIEDINSKLRIVRLTKRYLPTDDEITMKTKEKEIQSRLDSPEVQAALA